MRERIIEAHLRRRVQALGGECLKFVSPGRRHVSDRLCLFVGARIYFVETKRPDARLRRGQQRFGKVLTDLGFVYKLLDTRAKIDAWLLTLFVGHHHD